MGFFDSLKKALVESYEVGKESYDRQNKWKKEEAEYKNSAKSRSITIHDIIRVKDIIDLNVEKKELDLKIKYMNNSKEVKTGLLKEREEKRTQIEELKRSRDIYQDDEDDTELKFHDRYNIYRNRRAALCISYLSHSKASEAGMKDALSILLMSPYCITEKDVRRDFSNLKTRYRIYENALKKDLSALDYCFYNHLPGVDMVPMDKKTLGEKWCLDYMMLSSTCENSMNYNDEMYGTHFGNLDFYGLTITYDEKKMSQEKQILLDIIKWRFPEK